MTQQPVDPNFALGEKCLDTGQWAEAEEAFRRFLDTNASSAQAHSKRGVALIHLRRLPEAEQAFSRAVALDPKYAPAWSNLGNVYRETRRTDEALQAYERAIAADPDYWIAYQNLGGLYKQLGRTGEAIATLKKATRLSIKAPIRQGGAEGRGRTGCLGRAAAVALILVGAVAALVKG